VMASACASGVKHSRSGSALRYFALPALQRRPPPPSQWRAAVDQQSCFGRIYSALRRAMIHAFRSHGTRRRIGRSAVVFGWRRRL
jgi:hypothetical protein